MKSPLSYSTAKPSLPPVAAGQRNTGNLVAAGTAFCGAQQGKFILNCA